jgi:hypothetical protein
MKPKGKPIKWDSNIAYAVGLITTDGNLSPDGRHICMVSNDIQLLETFRNCLNLSNKICPKRSGYTGLETSHKIQFGNVIFYKWLLDLGLTPKKSKTINNLKIPDEYFFNFLRGHLDGDGYIRKYQDKVFPKSQRLYLNFYSASAMHLQWLQKSIKNLSGANGKISKKTNEYVLIYAKKESLKLIPLIYPNKNVPRLQRKYEIVKEFI